MKKKKKKKKLKKFNYLISKKEIIERKKIKLFLSFFLEILS